MSEEQRLVFEEVGKLYDGGVVVRVTHIAEELRGDLDITIGEYNFMSASSPQVDNDDDIVYLPGDCPEDDSHLLPLNAQQYQELQELAKRLAVSHTWCGEILTDTDICARGRAVMQNCDTFEDWLKLAKTDEEAQKWALSLDDEDQAVLIRAMFKESDQNNKETNSSSKD